MPRLAPLVAASLVSGLLVLSDADHAQAQAQVTLPAPRLSGTRTPRPAPAPVATPAPVAAPASVATRPPAPIPTPPQDPADDAPDDPWEERKIRAREDVEYLETFLRAKQAECREAEQRVTTFTTWRVDQERMKQKGIVSPFQSNIAGLNMTEYQSELEMRKVEVKDAEIRLNRAKRRLKQVERSGTIPPTDADSPNNDDRVRELELKVERLRKEVERSSRYTETKRHAMEM